ncbi:NADH-quinone oxidoreductase subunit M [Marinithermofilum abyssi]|uniref:NADH-quinone oxidoreductase subunit M n=1 Tax=Marinithermofilum abyssi TaxID=1571185 RepID=A0A8J2Y8J9_9BACL|nr:NADH-quinone oxidoreductase subunit M [Marinithermofilum abyssi]GGE05149.1 NADH-quinone oxidoreductase subunit M [Marinithermofilum abyssi]
MEMLPSWITWAPLLGVLVLLWIPRERTAAIRWVGVLATLPSLVLSLLLYVSFDTGKDGVQFAHSLHWFYLPVLGEKWDFQYSMGVDGLSMPLVAITGVIVTLAALASLYIRQRQKGYFLLFLLLEVGMMGVFLARNLFLFFLFFEITLVAAFFLIGIWGYVNREKTAIQFLLYNGLGSACMLLAFMGLLILFRSLELSRLHEVMHHSGALAQLSQSGGDTLLWGIFIALVIAFGIKLPIFPFHTWMLRVHAEAPPAVVMIHSGVLLKMGAYGLIRFGVELFPVQTQAAAGVLAWLGLVNILYGAVLAFSQRDLKRVLAYSSVSHMGIILLGIASLNVYGLQGAVFQSVSHGFISALLFYFIAALYERTGTTQIDQLGGLAKQMPVLSGIFLAGGMALLGLPGMSGFVSEFLAFLGLFETRPWVAATGTLGLILAAVYTLRAVMQTTFGPLHAGRERVKDSRWTEAVPMLVLLFFIVLIGVYPDVIGKPMQLTLQTIISRMGG